MKYHGFIFIISLLSLCNCATRAAFERAKEVNTREAYEDFLKRHSTGAIADSARQILIDFDYKDVLEKNEIDAYAEFIELHPNYAKNRELQSRINDCFVKIIREAENGGAEVIFNEVLGDASPRGIIASGSKWRLKGGTFEYAGIKFLSDPLSPLKIFGDMLGRVSISIHPDEKGRGIVFVNNRLYVFRINYPKDPQ